jgi:hypothetical protein
VIAFLSTWNSFTNSSQVTHRSYWWEVVAVVERMERYEVWCEDHKGAKENRKSESRDGDRVLCPT